MCQLIASAPLRFPRSNNGVPGCNLNLTVPSLYLAFTVAVVLPSLHDRLVLEFSGKFRDWMRYHWRILSCWMKLGAFES